MSPCFSIGWVNVVYLDGGYGNTVVLADIRKQFSINAGIVFLRYGAVITTPPHYC